MKKLVNHECQICGHKAIKLARHFKEKHSLILGEKNNYFNFINFNYPNLINSIVHDLTHYIYPKTTIQNEDKYNELNGIVQILVKLLNLTLDPIQSKKLKENRKKKTCIEKYGVDIASKSKEVKEKIENTNLIKYGYKSALSHPEVKDKKEKTNLIKYGNKFGSQIFIDKMGGFSKNKELASRAGTIGARHPKNVKHQTDFFKSEEFKTWKNQWRIDNPEKAKAHKLARAKTSKFHMKLKEAFSIQNIETETEYSVLSYFIDEYDRKTNTCIEFMGDYWHCNPTKYHENFIHPEIKLTAKEIWERDEIRLNKIRQQGYNIFIIWESDCIFDKVKEYKQTYGYI